MTKSHAEHNEDVCDFLMTSGKYNDWVVTTAFYSAMHFVQNEIFPLALNGETYNNFNHYYNKRIRGKKQSSKHSVTQRLVDSELPKLAGKYRWLFNACITSRYHDYIVSEAKAKTARTYLNEIKADLKK